MRRETEHLLNACLDEDGSSTRAEESCRRHPDWKACMVRLKDENEDWRATVFEKVAYSPVRLFN